MMGKAKRAHQFRKAGQRLSFEDGEQIDFREKDREKKICPLMPGSVPINPSEFLVFFNRSSVVSH